MLILVTGGSGSGKSAFAESVVMGLKTRPNLYIATMYPFDEECHRRIARHRLMRRDKGFETLECYTGLKDAKIPSSGTTLLECMSNLTANEMYQENGSGDACVQEILKGIHHVLSHTEHLVIVTNEIFSDGIKYDPETTRYQQYLGEMNCELAKLADVVVEVVYSIPLVKKERWRELCHYEKDLEQFFNRICHVFQDPGTKS